MNIANNKRNENSKSVLSVSIYYEPPLKEINDLVSMSLVRHAEIISYLWQSYSYNANFNSLSANVLKAQLLTTDSFSFPMQ